MMTKRKVFLRYFAVFCVPVLLLGSLLWANNLWYTYRETADLRAAALEQMVESLDLLVDQTQAVADKACANESFTAARRDQAEDYRRIAQWVGLYEDLLSEDIVLAYYLLGDLSIVTRDGALAYGAFEGKYADAKSFSLAGFFLTLNQSPRFVTSNLYRKSGAYYAMAFTYPITDESARHVGTLCFLIPRTVLLTTFGKYFPETQARLTVLDAWNQPVFTELDGMDDPKALSRLGGLGLAFQDRDKTVLRAVSRHSRFTYYVTMPKAAFYQAASRDMGLLIALEGVLTAFSATVALLLARSHYSSILRMQRRNLSLEDELGAQDDIIRSLVLRKLLDGSPKEAKEIDYNLRCANIQYYHPRFFVAVVEFAAGADEDSESAAFLRAFDGRNSSDVYYQALLRPEHRQAAVIVNTILDQRALAAALSELLRSAALQSPLGLSQSHDSPLALNNAYVEAVVAIRERLFPADNRLFRFASVSEPGLDFHLPMLERSIIQESVRNDNQEMVERSVAAIFERIASAHNPQIALCACYDAVNLCIRLYEHFAVPLPGQRLLELSRFSTPQGLCQTVQAALGELCALVREKNRSVLASTKYNLIGFVQERFRDGNLSLALLADEFGLSQSYISKLFKEETGQNFISYVRQLRLSYVKKQLTETDRQVKDIILETGYADVANFARTFRQEEGLTPLQYRQAMRQRNASPGTGT